LTYPIISSAVTPHTVLSPRRTSIPSSVTCNWYSLFFLLRQGNLFIHSLLNGPDLDRTHIPARQGFVSSLCRPPRCYSGNGALCPRSPITKCSSKSAALSLDEAQSHAIEALLLYAVGTSSVDRLDFNTTVPIIMFLSCRDEVARHHRYGSGA